MDYNCFISSHQMDKINKHICEKVEKTDRDRWMDGWEPMIRVSWDPSPIIQVVPSS